MYYIIIGWTIYAIVFLILLIVTVFIYEWLNGKKTSETNKNVTLDTMYRENGKCH